MRVVVTRSSIILDGGSRSLDIRRTRGEDEIQSKSHIARNSAHVRIRDFNDGIGVSCNSLAAYLVGVCVCLPSEKKRHRYERYEHIQPT